MKIVTIVVTDVSMDPRAKLAEESVQETSFSLAMLDIMGTAERKNYLLDRVLAMARLAHTPNKP